MSPVCFPLFVAGMDRKLMENSTWVECFALAVGFSTIRLKVLVVISLP